MKNNQKEKVVYIAGNGRSGSTILDILLNTFDTSVTLGEVNVIPWEIKEKRQLCGCGEKVNNCRFWSKVLNESGEILKTGGEIDKFRDSHTKGKVFRLKELLREFFGFQVNKKRLKKFCSDNYEFLKDIKKVNNNTSLIVDSSKDPYRLSWLIHCNSIEVKPIHLVKDPRAYVYSMIRKDNKVSLFKIARKSFGWFLNNTIIDFILRDEDYYFLKYEVMASDANKFMHNISSWLGLSYKDGQYKKFREVENHGLAGNISRMKSDDVYLDEKWKDNLTKTQEIIIKTITYPLGKKYGYFK